MSKENKTPTLEYAFKRISKNSNNCLLKILNLDSRIIKLVINKCQIEDNVGLWQGLSINKTIKKLIYNSATEEISDKETEIIKNFIIDNSKLTSLVISYNKMSIKGLENILSGLEANTRITKLDLSSCSLTDEHITSIKNFLTDNTWLKSLKLLQNYFTDEGCKLLSEALKENSTLNSLKIKNNKFGKEGRKSLVQTVSNINSHIYDLKIESDKSDSVSDMTKIFKANMLKAKIAKYIGFYSEFSYLCDLSSNELVAMDPESFHDINTMGDSVAYNN